MDGGNHLSLDIGEMPVSQADMFLVAAANTPTDDMSTMGGGLSTNTKIITDPGVLPSGNELITASSDATETALTVEIEGFGEGGSRLTQSVVLNGATPSEAYAAMLDTVIRVEIVTGTAVGNITIKIDTLTVVIMDDTATSPLSTRVNKAVVLFFNADTSPDTLYDKAFIINDSATETLDNANVRVNPWTAEDSEALKWDLEDPINGTATTLDRTMAPTAAQTVNDTFVDAGTTTKVALPGTADLTPGDRIGVWFQLSNLNKVTAYASGVGFTVLLSGQ